MAERSPTAFQDRFAVARQVERGVQPRIPVSPVGETSLADAACGKRKVCGSDGGFAAGGGSKGFVAAVPEPGVQGQPAADGPFVLQEDRVVSRDDLRL